jgi:hypothetical protein
MFYPRIIKMPFLITMVLRLGPWGTYTGDTLATLACTINMIKMAIGDYKHIAIIHDALNCGITLELIINSIMFIVLAIGVF